MFRNDARHSGFSMSMRPSANSVLWTFTASGAVEASPAVVDGRVYITSDDGSFHCLDAWTGVSKWNYTVGSVAAQYVSSPAVVNGMVYLGSYMGAVYGLNASNGVQVWNFTTGDRVFSSPCVAGGRIYVGAYDGSGLLCLDALVGAMLWNYSTGGQIFSSPATFDNRVYVGSIQDHGVYCVNALDGGKIWNYTTGGAVWSSPAVADGKVYVGSNDNKTYCFDALNGALVWNYTTGYLVESSPAAVDGKVYVGSHDGNVYCLNGSTGALIWNHTTGSIVASSPAYADGRVYVGCYDNKIYCLDASTGAHVWNYTTGNYVFSSPAVVNAKVYFGSADQTVYCLGAQIPLFDLVAGQRVESEATVNVTYNFRDLTFNAPAGSVWVPEERVVCSVALVNDSLAIPRGNLSEPALSFDINGDGDSSDTYAVEYVDNATALIDGAIAHAQLEPGRRFIFPTPEGYGVYYLHMQRSFQLGSKNHTLHKITYPTGDKIGYAEFGLDSTFRHLSGPALQLTIEQLSPLLAGMPSVQLVSMRFNGTLLPTVSSWLVSQPHAADGQWLVDKTYLYSLGGLQTDDVFTLELSFRGDPGTFLLLADLNWSPDGVGRYQYPNVAAFALTGTVQRSIAFGDQTYPVEIYTNCTFPAGIIYNWTGKELDFNSTLLGSFTYFWNVSIPQALLRGNPWTINVPATLNGFSETSNATHAFLYFVSNAEALVPDFSVNLVSLQGTWGLQDTFPPRVSIQQRNPTGAVSSMQSVRVSINASDIESGVTNATLYYLSGNATSWSAQQMAFNDTTNFYEAVIPGQEAGAHVSYRMIVFDAAGNNATIESEYFISGGVWMPSPQGAAVAATVSVCTTAAVSALASVAGSSAGQAGSKLGGKIDDLLPDTVKKWLADSISSRNKVQIKEKAGSWLLLTRKEAVSYAVTMVILTVAFAYAKSESLGQIWESIPLILATSIFVEFVKSYIMTAITRHMGVWTEHRVWYLGLSLFAFSTLAFKVPFSSPAKLARYSPKMNKRLDGLLSSISIVLAFAFALVFLILLLAGFTLIGNIGLIMCLTGVLFDALPIPPMGGKGIFDWHKAIWLALFAASLASYVASLMIL